MKKPSNFIEFNNRSCIKNNLITSSIFILMLVFMAFLLNREMKDLDNGRGNVGGIAIIFCLAIVLMIIITIIMPLFIDIYIEFNNNLKSLIGLWSCNLIVFFILIWIFEFFMEPIIYLLFTILGSLMSLICKYIYLKRK